MLLPFYTQLETATDPLELNPYSPIDPIESHTDILYDYIYYLPNSEPYKPIGEYQLKCLIICHLSMETVACVFAT